ncbi:MAG: NUDIX domain-containing protein, partial [Clostridia bacterium]|nr:NUDIX domain-containing protein [Clostridia bacterium]
FDKSSGEAEPRPGALRVILGTAHELSGQEHPSRVYIFSTTALRGIVKLRVVGIISREKRTIAYVAAPDRVTVFEPHIRELLGDRIDDRCSILCLNEKSCGAVIFRKRSGNLEFLLVKNKKGGNWGFPKGHIEMGETEQDTAKREVLEETGLAITPIEDFRVLSEYHPRGRIFKQVVFFLAEMPEGGEVVPQQAEIDRYIWADYGLAMRTFRFNNDRNVLTKARDRLRSF